MDDFLYTILQKTKKWNYYTIFSGVLIYSSFFLFVFYGNPQINSHLFIENFLAFIAMYFLLSITFYIFFVRKLDFVIKENSKFIVVCGFLFLCAFRIFIDFFDQQNQQYILKTYFNVTLFIASLFVAFKLISFFTKNKLDVPVIKKRFYPTMSSDKLNARLHNKVRNADFIADDSRRTSEIGSLHSDSQKNGSRTETDKPDVINKS